VNFEFVRAAGEGNLPRYAQAGIENVPGATVTDVSATPESSVAANDNFDAANDNERSRLRGTGTDGAMSIGPMSPRQDRLKADRDRALLGFLKPWKTNRFSRLDLLRLKYAMHDLVSGAAGEGFKEDRFEQQWQMVQAAYIHYKSIASSTGSGKSLAEAILAA